MDFNFGLFLLSLVILIGIMLPIKLVLNEDKKHLRPFIRRLQTKERTPKEFMRVRFLHLQYNMYYVNRKKSKLAKVGNGLYLKVPGVGRLKIPSGDLQVVEFRAASPTAYRVRLEIKRFPGAYISLRLDHKHVNKAPGVLKFLLEHRPFSQ